MDTGDRVNDWYIYGCLRGFNGPMSYRDRDRAVIALIKYGTKWIAYCVIQDCVLRDELKAALIQFVSGASPRAILSPSPLAPSIREEL